MPRKKIKKPVTLFYPNELSVRELRLEVVNYYRSENHSGGYLGKTKERDYYLFFHILVERYLRLEACDSKYIQIHSDIVQDVFGRDYAKVISALAANKYILVDEYYCELFGICRSYAIHPRLMTESKPLLAVEIEFDTVLHNKLDRIGHVNLTKPFDAQSQEMFDDGREHVIAMTSQLMLVPSEEALAYVQACYEAEGNPNSPYAYFHHFNYNPMRGGGVDKFGKRVHSIITRMPKIIRACLRFKSAPDMPTKEADFVNSQPYFLSVIDSTLIGLFAPECYSAIPIYERYRGEDEFVKFAQLCSTGWIYEEFISLYRKTYNESYGSDDDEARNITKTLIYSAFFSDYEQTEKGLGAKSSRTDSSRIKKNFFQLFKTAFEPVYRLFVELKALYWSFTVNSKGERKQFANNCLLAQRVESGIMYERVIPNLLAHGITDVVTIHDCIIVKECDTIAAKEVMTETFAQLSLSPKIN